MGGVSESGLDSFLLSCFGEDCRLKPERVQERDSIQKQKSARRP